MAQDNYAGVLWEEMNERIKLIQESLVVFKDVPADIAQMKADLAEMKQWKFVVKEVIKDQSKTLNNHEVRLTKLETA